MPCTPLRHLKPELFTDEQQKMNMLAIEDFDSDEEIVDQSDDMEDNNDEDLLQNDDMNFEEENNRDNDNAGVGEDVPLLEMKETVQVHRADDDYTDTTEQDVNHDDEETKLMEEADAAEPPRAHLTSLEIEDEVGDAADRKTLFASKNTTRGQEIGTDDEKECQCSGDETGADDVPLLNA